MKQPAEGDLKVWFWALREGPASVVGRVKNGVVSDARDGDSEHPHFYSKVKMGTHSLAAMIAPGSTGFLFETLSILLGMGLIFRASQHQSLLLGAAFGGLLVAAIHIATWLFARFA